MNGLKYWDPEESTRTKWETTYASELQARGLTQDFTGLSTLLLGQAQPAQFQSADQTGYWWGSKVSDDGNFTALDALTINTNAEIPRSYKDNANGADSYGGYYNWFAATTESGTYTMAGGNAEDSLCPSGWKLSGYNGNKSLRSLLNATYSLGDSEEGSLLARMFPLSFVFTHRYNFDGQLPSIANRNADSYYWTSAATDNISALRLSIRTNRLLAQLGDSKAFGASIRCVKK